MFKKRLFAYVIDFLILGVVLSFIGMLIPTGSNVVKLNDELQAISNSFLSSDIDVVTYVNQYSAIGYNLDKEMFLSSLIDVVVSILYFVVIPLYNNGQSIGKRLIGIKIVGNDDSSVSANGLIFRYLLMNSIGVSILAMCFLFVLKDFNYLICISILSFLQFLVVILSIFMVLYRNDKRSLPDLVAGTKVIEVEK